jgi:hypothetical protein
MQYPHSMGPIGLELVVVAHGVTSFGETWFDCTYGDVRLKRFWLKGNVEQDGFDAFKSHITSEVFDQVIAALQVPDDA